MRRMRSVWKIVAAVLISAILFTSVALSAEEVVSGILESAEEGIVLIKNNGERLVVFGDDLSKMVGKTVQVTGRVEEGPYGKSIWVSEVHQVIKDR